MGVSCHEIFVFDQFPLQLLPVLAFLMAECKVNNVGMYPPKCKDPNNSTNVGTMDISRKGQEKRGEKRDIQALQCLQRRILWQ